MNRGGRAGILPRWGEIVVIVAALGVLLAPNLNKIPGDIYRDACISHLPQILYLRRALLHWHTIPLWAPTYYSGYPFYADPLAEIFYPPAWLMVVLPLPWGLWIVAGLHLFASAVGMYALLRHWGRGRSAALLGALAWMLLPKIWAHWGAGHISLVFAVSWTPWLLLMVERRNRWLPAVAVWALIFLADPRWSAYSALLWAFWEAKKALPRLRFRFSPYSLISQFPNSSISRSSLLIPLLISPLAIPLLHYSRLSTRAALTARDVLFLSLPPWRLAGLVLPVTNFTHEWQIYVGAVPFLLAVLAWGRRRAHLWLGVALAATIWSLGKYLPGMDLVARLPLVDMLRVPPRSMFLCGFAFAVAAAEGLDLLLAEGKDALGAKGRFWMFVATVLVAFFGLGFLALAGNLGRAALAFLVWMGAFVLLVADLPIERRSIALIAVLLADLLVVDFVLTRSIPFSQAFATPQVLDDAVAQTPSPFRIYTPSYSVPQNLAAARGWELANGVDPLVLASYARFMEKASGVPDEGYSVIIPPMKDGYLLANAPYKPNAAWLGLLNVRLVVAAFPVRADGLDLVGTDGKIWVYRNRRALPRVWVQPALGDEPPSPQSVRPAHLDCWCPNHLRATATGAGVLVFSEVAYPGWQAFVDGKRVPLKTAYGVLRAVPLPAGEHTVELRFRPTDLVIGLLLGAIGLLAWLFGIFKAGEP